MNHNVLNFEEFEQLVKDYFQENNEPDVRVDIRTVLKNNGVTLRGLSIFKKGEKVTPTVYLEEFYEFYLQGISMERVLQHMQTVYMQRKQSADIDVSYFYQYDSVKDTLRIKLINYEKNQKFLEKVPHMRLLDFAVVCYSVLNSEMMQNLNIAIYNQHLKMWSVTKEQLLADAVMMCRRHAPEVILRMSELLDELQKELSEDMQTELPKPKDDTEMCILTNCNKIDGAAVICYPAVLDKCGRYYQSDFYMLPSSVHEMILLPVHAGGPEELLSMVHEVNTQQVAEEEILSYHVFRYYWREGVLKDVSTMETVKMEEMLQFLEA